jgi:hypothetical protein
VSRGLLVAQIDEWIYLKDVITESPFLFKNLSRQSHQSDGFVFNSTLFDDGAIDLANVYFVVVDDAARRAFTFL